MPSIKYTTGLSQQEAFGYMELMVRKMFGLETGGERLYFL